MFYRMENIVTCSTLALFATTGQLLVACAGISDADPSQPAPECQVHSDCGPGELCDGSTGQPACVEAPPELLCDRSAQCTPPQECNENGVCADPSAVIGCTSDAGCGAGNVCNEFGACVSSGNAGSECTASADCGNDLECRNYECKAIAGSCLRDVVAPPPGTDLCSCTWEDCEATQISCNCNGECYQADPSIPVEGCMIVCDSSGQNCVTHDQGLNDLGCVAMSCVPKEDIPNPAQGCSLTDCTLQPSIIQVEPQAPQVAPVLLQNQVVAAGLMFTIDTSGSMQSKQAAAACAVDSFFDVVDGAGAQWSAGALSQDVIPQYSGDNQTGDPNSYVELAGGCDSVPSCSCDASGGIPSYGGPFCDLQEQAEPALPLRSTEADAEDMLRKEIVMKDWNQTGNDNNDEAGLEACVTRIMLDYPNHPGQCVPISDESANSDHEMCGIQDQRDFNLAYYQGVLGADFNPPATAGSCDDKLREWYIYFFNFVGVQVNVLCDRCGKNSTDDCDKNGQAVYVPVAVATHGGAAVACSAEMLDCGGTRPHCMGVGDIYDCNAYTTFFQEVGTSTAEYSTGLCLPPDRDFSADLRYMDGSANGTPVPDAATNGGDGYTYSATSRCYTLSGPTWGGVVGTFSAGGGTGPGQPDVCLDQDVLVQTVSCPPLGMLTPDQWSYDPVSTCISLNVPPEPAITGTCDIEYFAR